MSLGDRGIGSEPFLLYALLDFSNPAMAVPSGRNYHLGLHFMLVISHGLFEQSIPEPISSERTIHLLYRENRRFDAVLV